MASRVRSIISGSIGNLVEWYDWYVYSAFALYFAPAFFPKGNLTAQLLNSAAVFAVGFLMRPLGGWLMGVYADRHGRKAALLLSVLLMCGGSLLVAITPSYDQIGVGAPVLLVVARLLQGLSVGGEYGTSATYLSEMADERNRGFFSSFQYVTLIAGQLLALLVQLGLQQGLSTPELYAWGWRVPFVVGAAAAVVALYLRRTMEETDAFVQQEAPPPAAGKAPQAPSKLRVLMRYPREVLTVVGMTLGGTIAFYTFTTYSQKFLVNTAGFTKDQSTLISFGALAVAMVLQPVVGAISDRVGRRPVLLFFWGRRHVGHGATAHRPEPRQQRVGGIRLAAGGAGHRQRLHGHQCGSEGRVVSDGNPGAGGRAALRADGSHLRWHGRVRGPTGKRPGRGGVVLLVRHGLRGPVAGGVLAHARYQAYFADGGGVGPSHEAPPRGSLLTLFKET